jgi:hypothetical protein
MHERLVRPQKLISIVGLNEGQFKLLTSRVRFQVKRSTANIDDCRSKIEKIHPHNPAEPMR